MINKRVKEGIRKIKRPKSKIKLSLGTIALILGSVLLLIISAFTQIKVNINIPYSTLISGIKMEYIPQIPVVIFVGALLGSRWGIISILLYIILGLTPKYPVFGMGGGLSYVFQYSFGYIIGFLFGAIVTTGELREKYILKFITAPLYGVLIIHFFGVVYMTIIALLRSDSFSFIYELIYYQSVSKMLYDIIFSIIAVLIAKVCRKFLWIII